MNIPFIDLQPTTEQIREEYLKQVDLFLQRENFILSPEVQQFEQAWAKTIGTEFSVGVSNGADALYLALLVLDIGAGDEVITQGTAYNASVTAILRTGAVPRFADIDEKTLTLTAESAAKLITNKTKAILPVHLYGVSGDIEALVKLAQEHSLFVIEDCAQAHLAEYKGKKLGNWGDIGCWSFYPTKNLGAFGDAGALTFNNPELLPKLQALRNLGQSSKNVHDFLGTNMRLDPIQAIALNLKLNYLADNTAKRVEAADYYRQQLKKLNSKICLPEIIEGASPVYHLFVIRLLQKNRDEAVKLLNQAGVNCAVHYPVAVYNQPFFKGLKDYCPVTDLVLSQIISLPFWPQITHEQQDYVISSLDNVCQ